MGSWSPWGVYWSHSAGRRPQVRPRFWQEASSRANSLDSWPNKATNSGESASCRPSLATLLRGQTQGKHTSRCGINQLDIVMLQMLHTKRGNRHFLEPYNISWPKRCAYQTVHSFRLKHTRISSIFHLCHKLLDIHC